MQHFYYVFFFNRCSDFSAAATLSKSLQRFWVSKKKSRCRCETARQFWVRRKVFFFCYRSSTRGCKIQRFFESHGGKIWWFFDFHGGKILGFKKYYGCKKKNSATEGGRKTLVFFWCKSKISVGKYFFLTSQEVKFLTFQNFTVRFGPFSNLAGVSFRENWNPTDVRFGDIFLGGLCWGGLEKKFSPNPD